MGHRTAYRVLNVRNVCHNKCFQGYEGNNNSPSACDGGCGCGPRFNEGCAFDDCQSDVCDFHRSTFKDPVPLPNLPAEIGKSTLRTWLYVLDFFDHRNLDIFKALPDQDKTPLAVEGCVRTFYDNYFANYRIHALKRKGVDEIWFGVESGDRSLRDGYGKLKFTNDELLEVMNELRENGIKVAWYLVYGDNDTRETLLETNKLVQRGKPDLTWMSLLKKAS